MHCIERYRHAHASYILDLNARSERARRLSVSTAQLDMMNGEIVRKYLHSYGFPCVHRIRLSGLEAIWLIVQHTDDDVSLQEFVHRLMIELPQECRGTLSYRAWLGYLSDRIAVNQNRKQFFGTQYYRRADGELVRRPVALPSLLWWRRLWVGLPPAFKELKALRIS